MAQRHDERVYKGAPYGVAEFCQQGIDINMYQKKGHKQTEKNGHKKKRCKSGFPGTAVENGI